MGEFKFKSPGVYYKEKDISIVESVFFCECCDSAFKKYSYYLDHIRKKKMNKIKSMIKY
jgi:hypothetical protein